MLSRRSYRNRAAAFLAALLALCLGVGCSKIQDIKVTSCSVDSFTPKGLRAAAAKLSICVENPDMEFTLSDISGTLFYKGKDFVLYSAEPVQVGARSTAVYPLSCTASLADGVSVLALLSLLKEYDLADFSTTLQAKVTLKSGLSKKLKFKDIPISDLIND